MGKSKNGNPKTIKSSYKGLVTLREALVHSSNLATINLVNDIGLPQLLKSLRSLG